jgi:hypothetical protein
MAVKAKASGRVGTGWRRACRPGAEHQSRRHRLDDLPAHRAVAVVGAHAGDRGDDDGGHRGAERQVHGVLGRKALRREQHEQQRHDGQPAADAEQAGDEAGEAAEQRIGEPPGISSLPFMLFR